MAFFFSPKVATKKGRSPEEDAIAWTSGTSTLASSNVRLSVKKFLKDNRIGEKLLQSTINADSNTGRFITEHSLSEIWTKIVVTEFLRTLGYRGRKLLVNEVIKHLVKTLSILVTIEWEEWELFGPLFFGPTADTIRDDRTDKILPYKGEVLRHPSFLGRWGVPFFRDQNMYLPLLIEEGRNHVFPRTRPLPFILSKTERIAQGDYGSVKMEYIAAYQFKLLNNKNDTQGELNRELPVARKYFQTKGDFQKEIKLLLKFNEASSSHERIVKYLAIFTVGEEEEDPWASKEFNILLPLANTDLKIFLYQYDLQYKSKYHAVLALIQEATNLADAIRWLHAGLAISGKAIICYNMGIKLDTILVYFDPFHPVGLWKISDLGIRSLMQGKNNDHSSYQQSSLTEVRSPAIILANIITGSIKSSMYLPASTFSAPELSLGQEVGLMADIFSFGCMLFQVLVRGAGGIQLLKNLDEQRASVRNGSINDHFCQSIGNVYRINPTVANWLKSRDDLGDGSTSERAMIMDCKLIIEKALRLDPKHRPSAEELHMQLNEVASGDITYGFDRDCNTIFPGQLLPQEARSMERRLSPLFLEASSPHDNMDDDFVGENMSTTQSFPISTPSDHEPAALTSFNITFRRNPDFIIPQALLSQLRQKCSVPAARIALVGLAGVGKTQLAIEYSYQIRLQSSGVFWVNASNTARFKETFCDIADYVNIPERKAPKADIFTLVHEWLRDEQNGQWLLVLDNVDNVPWLLEAHSTSEVVQASAPHDRFIKSLWQSLQQNQNGSILITTRSRAAAVQLVGERNIINVGSMNAANAIALFERTLGTQSNREDISKLVAALGYLPIAIVHVATEIKQSEPKCSVRQYIEKLYQDSDVKSVTSSKVESVFTDASRGSSGSATTANTSTEESSARDIVVALLTKDADLTTNAEIGLKRMPPERFQRNFTRLLKSFSRDLKVVAKTEMEKNVAYLVRRQRVYISNSFRACMESGSKNIWTQEQLDEKEEQLNLMENWLKGVRESHSDHFASRDEVKSREENSDGSEGSGDSEDDETLRITTETRFNLQQLETFATSGDSIEVFRKRLKDFVSPPAVTSGAKIGQPEENPHESDNKVQMSSDDNVVVEDVNNVTVPLTENMLIESNARTATKSYSKVQFEGEDDTGIMRIREKEVTISNPAGEAQLLLGGQLRGDNHANITQNIWLPIAVSSLLETGRDIITKCLKSFIKVLLLPKRSWEVFRWPATPLGCIRIAWRCKCGQLLYLDVPEDKRDEGLSFAKEAAGIANEPTIRIIPTPSRKSSRSTVTNPSPTQHQELSPLTSERYSQSSISGVNSQGMNNSNVRLSEKVVLDGRKRFLLLCINRAVSRVELSNVDLTRCMSDEQLFNQVRDAYNLHNGKRVTRWFVIAKYIEYVKFELVWLRNSGQCIGAVKRDQLPPKKEVSLLRYHYYPCPLEMNYPSHLFMHCFNNPGDHAPSQALNQLPKKLNDELRHPRNELASEQTAVESVFGWGIYIGEGLDWTSITLAFSAGLAISVIITIIYWGVKNDVQGATGLGALMVSIIAIYTALISVSWDPDRNKAALS